MTRFCPSCHTEVEERDGFCLLGHPLRLEAPSASLTELRAEVDKAFEAAQAELDAIVHVTEIPNLAATPSTPVSMTPPPPPPASGAVTRFQFVWEKLEAEEPAEPSDPITAFAPPPRMDWGPKRGDSRLKMRFARSRATKLA
jgi:hypothetical protein